MLNKVKNQKGEAILGLIIVAPFLIYFVLYLIFVAMFFIRKNEMQTITNKMLDRALVEGQFTPALLTELKAKLKDAGFGEENLVIKIAPESAGDSNLSYAKRGTEIEIIVIYNKPHNLYFLSFGVGEESMYYIGTKLSGMSEKW